MATTMTLAPQGQSHSCEAEVVVLVVMEMAGCIIDPAVIQMPGLT